ncbi:MAG: polyprenyl diphosphate synthase, partial [Bacillota bacterium]|nr:polyprenyl diphosphate synthase [Bacillota bacterium]
KSYMKDLMKYNMKVTMIGDKTKLPKQTREVIEDAIKGTSKNTGMILNFAMNYGSRADIAKAATKIAKDYKKGKLKSIKEDTISNYLSTSKLPEVDLMIRTSNEIRISNFLLYELAYSELIFIDKYWPDFSEKDFDNCLEEYNNRTRRFGDAK